MSSQPTEYEAYLFHSTSSCFYLQYHFLHRIRKKIFTQPEVKTVEALYLFHFYERARPWWYLIKPPFLLCQYFCPYSQFSCKYLSGIRFYCYHFELHLIIFAQMLSTVPTDGRVGFSRLFSFGMRSFHGHCCGK